MWELQRQQELDKLPVVWMFSPGNRGTLFWNILALAPNLRPGRFCSSRHRRLSWRTRTPNTNFFLLLFWFLFGRTSRTASCPRPKLKKQKQKTLWANREASCKRWPTSPWQCPTTYNYTLPLYTTAMYIIYIQIHSGSVRFDFYLTFFFITYLYLSLYYSWALCRLFILRR